MHRRFTPVTVCLIHDAVWTAKHTHKSLVLVGASSSIPEDLSADATLFFCPTPDVDEMEHLVDAITAT